MTNDFVRSAALVFFLGIGSITAFSQEAQKERRVAREVARTDVREGEQCVSGPERDALQMIKEGRHTFRFDTFGDEEFWGAALGLDRALAGAKLGGIGPGVSPKTALAVGLRVDVNALPPGLVKQLQQKRVDIDDQATKVALFKLDAVLGVKGFVNKEGQLLSVDITCAICHSTHVRDLPFHSGRLLCSWYRSPAGLLA